MKILMATDGSKDATTAMVGAARLLRKEELETDVLCIAPQLVLQGTAREGGARGQTRETYRAQVKKEGEQIAHRAQHALHRVGLNANPVVEFGSPAGEIIRLASDYDLVVVGAHGRYERRQPGLGPVSSLVVQNSRRTRRTGSRFVCANGRSRRMMTSFDE